MNELIVYLILAVEFAVIFAAVILFANYLDRKEDEENGLEEKTNK